MNRGSSEKRLLVVFLTNDNHLSNVKTLQSIYKQDYPNIYLAVCNDCTDQFQSERLLNNFEAGKPENIKRICYRENEHPMGEYLSQKQFWDCMAADYVVTLHSGEYFASPQALTNCIRYLSYNSSVSAVITKAELWSDDMKKRLSLYSSTKDDQVTPGETPQLNIENLRDCMMMCRIEALNNLDVQTVQSEKPVSQIVCSALLEQGQTVTTQPMSLCKFSQASIQNIAVSVPDTYGNSTLQSISELIQSSPARTLEMVAAADASEPISVSDKYRKIILKLYKYSSFSKLKFYAVIDLLIAIFATLLFLTEATVLIIAVKIMAVIAVMMFVWMLGMLACNLYFKKNPQRLVF